MTSQNTPSIDIDQQLLDADRVTEVLQRVLATEGPGMSRIAMLQAIESLSKLGSLVRTLQAPPVMAIGEVVEVGNLEGGDVRGVTVRRGTEFISLTGLTIDETRAAASFYGQDIAITLSGATVKSNQNELFCDANCVWTNHHPDCTLGAEGTQP